MPLHALSRFGLRAAFIAPLLAFSVAPLTSAPAPCTTFCLQGTAGPVFGRNYDWGIGIANVSVNRRGLAKTAVVMKPDEPARWTSKYGSITFNQYGHEFPSGGMNEAGLVVEIMWLTETKFPAPDKRKSLRELQWVQYQLDNCSTVDEVIATIPRLRVTQDSISIHFLVCDRSGEQASLEYLDGKMVVHRGDDLPIPALANDTYSDSMKYLEQFIGFGGEKPTPKSGSSLDRFVRASCGVVEYEPGTKQETIDYAFSILDGVRQGNYTKWSIVYDTAELAIHFKTTAAPAIKSMELGKFDFSPTAHARILNIDTPKPGDALERFVDYTTEANRKLVLHSWKETEFLSDFPEERVNMFITYPESVVPSQGNFLPIPRDHAEPKESSSLKKRTPWHATQDTTNKIPGTTG